MDKPSMKIHKNYLAFGSKVEMNEYQLLSCRIEAIIQYLDEEYDKEQSKISKCPHGVPLLSTCFVCSNPNLK